MRDDILGILHCCLACVFFARRLDPFPNNNFGLSIFCAHVHVNLVSISTLFHPSSHRPFSLTGNVEISPHLWDIVCVECSWGVMTVDIKLLINYGFESWNDFGCEFGSLCWACWGFQLTKEFFSGVDGGANGIRGSYRRVLKLVNVCGESGGLCGEFYALKIARICVATSERVNGFDRIQPCIKT